MTLKITVKDKKSELMKKGTFFARIYQVIDLGLQENDFNGIKSLKEQVLIGFEFSNELMSDGRPFVLSKKYNLSMDDKATLKKDVEAITGETLKTKQEKEAFDITSLINKVCTVNVVHKPYKDSTFANIGTVAGAPNGVNLNPLHNKPIVFSLDNYDEAVFNEIPEWIRKKINTAGHILGQQESSDDYDPLTEV